MWVSVLVDIYTIEMLLYSLTVCSYIVKLSKRIQTRSTVSGAYSPSQNSEFFHKTFPYFIWLLRDVTQSIPDDCKNIKEYFLKKVILVVLLVLGGIRLLMTHVFDGV